VWGGPCGGGVGRTIKWGRFKVAGSSWVKENEKKKKSPQPREGKREWRKPAKHAGKKKKGVTMGMRGA